MLGVVLVAIAAGLAMCAMAWSIADIIKKGWRQNNE